MLAVGTPALAAEPVGVIRAAGGATAVPDSYIVVFKDSAVARGRVGDTAQRLVRPARRHGRPAPTAPRCAASRSGSSAEAAARLAADPAVAYVEQNHTVLDRRHADPTRRPGAWTGSTSATCR